LLSRDHRADGLWRYQNRAAHHFPVQPGSDRWGLCRLGIKAGNPPDRPPL